MGKLRLSMIMLSVGFCSGATLLAAPRITLRKILWSINCCESMKCRLTPFRLRLGVRVNKCLNHEMLRATERVSSIWEQDAAGMMALQGVLWRMSLRHKFEGIFSDIKSEVRVHSGLSREPSPEMSR